MGILFRGTVLLCWVFFWCVWIPAVHSRTSDDINNNQGGLRSQYDAAYVDEIRETWLATEKLFRTTAEEYVNELFPALMKATDASKISPDCKAALLKVVVGVKKLRYWAIRMVDASGKIPMGIMTGTATALGSYDQCLDIEHHEEIGDDPILGQYCTLNIRPPDLPRPFKNSSIVIEDDESFMRWMYDTGRWMRYFPIRLGVCMPSYCSKHDLEKFSKFLVNGLNLRASVGNCETKTPTRWTNAQIFVVCAMTLLLAVVIAGTFWERANIRQEQKLGTMRVEKSNGAIQQGDIITNVVGTLRRVFFAFSFTSNTQMLLHPAPSGPHTLNVIHGIRVISCFWIILGHTYFLADIYTFVRFKRLIRLEELYTDFSFTIVENFLPVDTFFFVSGLLIVYSSWQKLKRKHGRIAYLSNILHRFWRMTPAYLFVIGLFLILPLIGSGPIWKETIDPLIDNCKQSWWTNILYINNYYPYSSMCLLHTWFQAVNMQFYIISLPILWFLYKYTTLAAMLICVLTLLSCGATGFVTYFFNLPPALLLLTSEWTKAVEQLNMVYFQPFTHFGPFCVGMLCGYYLVKKRDVRFTFWEQLLGWCVASVCLAVSLFGVYPFRAGYEVDPIINALYAGVHRTVWSIGLAWATVACATGHGGLINTCFSWRGLVPLSTLSYLIYLLHPLVVYCHVGSTREIVNLDHFTMCYSFLGHVVISVGFAYIVYVTVELPFTRLEKLVFKRKSSPAPEPDPNKEQLPGSGIDESRHVTTLKVKIIDSNKVY